MPGWLDEFVAAVGRSGRVDSAAAAGWAQHLPAGYREATAPEQAAADLSELVALSAVPGDKSTGAVDAGRAPALAIGRHRFAVGPGSADQPGTFRLRRYGDQAVELTSFLPVIESFGLAVLEAVPYHLHDPGGSEIHIDDFGLRSEAPASVDPGKDGPRLVAAIEATLAGEAEVDPLNRLVVAAGTGWREAGLLRAYRRYRHQTGSGPRDQALDEALVSHPAVASALIGYFMARFDPGGDGPGGPGAEAAREAVLDALGDVEHFAEDRALRGCLALVDATLRTNWFREKRRAALALKFDSLRVPDLPLPRPRVETFVYAPAVEGVHLRAGLVARGGIRYSDRPDDLRTEILDLAAAQVKKNAIIVPTGAKGGFVCRGEAPPAQVRAAYALFITGLLDVTDNVVADEVVPPGRVVRADGDDPYLVVAADKGTATFSDVANAISESFGFWLGDAFASGGSRGYDHKAMGITARGAWKAVERHFRQLGVDVARDPIRVVGVGDMSGDVFGNGMLMSKAIRLVAAFDHRHVFVDPDPDPEVSFAERARLASLPRSSWADYDSSLISAGGGVWSRDTKEIPLSEGARAALGVSEASIGPLGLISAILSAPVDLLWFGGIGTFIKAPNEADSEVADHANDAVRVTTNQVRARVIAEGGNLAITQRARVRYSRRGGRINTDFIDNAAGVATSDREVNLKILLRLAVEGGRLDQAGRDALLASVESDVAAEVLRQVDHSVATLDRAVSHSAADLDAYTSLMQVLEARAQLDRRVESLPDAEELAVRRNAGAGLIRPELAVLLAYAKSDLVASVAGSPLVRDPTLARVVHDYFPRAVRDHAGDLIPRHRLYGELAATGLAGYLVDEMGITWAHETAAELGVSLPDVAGCWWAAWEVLGADGAFAALEREAGALSADEEAAVHATLAGAVGMLARTYLVAEAGRPPSERVESDSQVAAALAGPADPVTWEAAKLADRAGEWAALAGTGDVALVQRATGRKVPEVAAALAAIDSRGAVAELAEFVAAVTTSGRWARWQCRALLDDIGAFRRRAATSALMASPGEAADEAVDRWLGERRGAVAGSRRLRTETSTGEADQLARAALAVRFLTAGV